MQSFTPLSREPSQSSDLSNKVNTPTTKPPQQLGPEKVTINASSIALSKFTQFQLAHSKYSLVEGNDLVHITVDENQSLVVDIRDVAIRSGISPAKLLNSQDITSLITHSLELDSFKERVDEEFPRDTFQPDKLLNETRGEIAKFEYGVRERIVDNALKTIDTDLSRIGKLRKEHQKLKDQTPFRDEDALKFKSIENRLNRKEKELNAQKQKLVEDKKFSAELKDLQAKANEKIPEGNVDNLEDMVKQFIFFKDRDNKISKLANSESPLGDIAHKEMASLLLSSFSEKGDKLDAHIKSLIMKSPEEGIKLLEAIAAKNPKSAEGNYAKAILGWCSLEENKIEGVQKKEDYSAAFISEAINSTPFDRTQVEALITKLNLDPKKYKMQLGQRERQLKALEGAKAVAKPNIEEKELLSASTKAILKRQGLDQEQIDKIQDLAQKMLKNPEASISEESDNVSLIKHEGEIYIRGKLLGEGASKKAKLITNIEGKQLARITVIKADEEPLTKERLEKLKNEKKLLTKLKGVEGVIQLVTVTDIKKKKGTQEPKEGMVLEYYSGHLGSLMIPNVAHRLEFLLAAAIGVKNAHDRGVYHRDIKPDNIFVNYDKEKLADSKAVVADFDISISRDDPNFVQNVKTGYGYFAAPETEDEGKWDAAKAKAPPGLSEEELAAKPDIYAFGETLRDLMPSRDSRPEIDQLVKEMTNENPWERPSMDDFINRLSLIIDLYP